MVKISTTPNPLEKLSLKTRVTLFTLSIFVITIWTLSYYAVRMLKDDMQNMLGAQQASSVSHLADNINQELENRIRILEKVASIITPDVLNNKKALQQLLEQRLILQGTFNGGVITLGLDGTVLADLPVSMGRVGINYIDREYISGTLKGGKPTIGKPVVGKKPLVPLFGMAVPIFDKQGIVIGTIVGVTNLDSSSFLDKITQHSYGKSGYYLLEEPSSRLVITGTDKSRIMTALPTKGINKLIDRHIEGHEDTGITVNPLGIEVLASAKRIPVAGWFLVAALPTTEAFAPINAMQQRIFIATILLTLLAGILTWWTLRHQLQIEAERQKEREALIQSSKMAELGNMLGAIIHQWKQPLNTIAIDIQDIKYAFKNGELDTKAIDEFVSSVMGRINFMSKTADDFRDFYKPSKERKAFSIVMQINSVIEMLKKQLSLNSISLTVDGDESLYVDGFASEFKQVILNIINNSIDVFEERQIKNRIIEIKVAQHGENTVLTISDNAGGIPVDLLPQKLFEPFASTKGDKGTGIGLSLSRTIIEESMHGKLSAENIGDGAHFTIELPITQIPSSACEVL